MAFSKATYINQKISDDTGIYHHSVRANFGIERNQTISWELDFKIINSSYNFFGVVSSKVDDFNNCPAKEMKHAYGLDDRTNAIYVGGKRIYTQKDLPHNIQWSRPYFVRDEEFKIRIIADWTQKKCGIHVLHHITKPRIVSLDMFELILNF